MSNTSRFSCDAEMQRVGPPVVADRRERVLLDQVVDRDRALVLDVRAGAADRGLVERDRDEALPDRLVLVAAHRRLRRIATERAWASSPSASPSAIAAGPSARSCSGPAFEDRGALHEVEHAEARREARRARGRQHVVGAADVVADRLRRVGAEEDRAGVADLRRPAASASARLDLEMLGRERVDQRHRLVEVAHQDDRAEVAPRRAGDRARAAASRAARSTACSTASASAASSVIRIDCAAASCSACASRSAAIQSGLPLVVGEDQHLGRARRSCRCRPCRRPGAWPPPHRRCRGRRSWRPARWSAVP